MYMVLSRIDESINYVERNDMEPDDINYDASMYAVDIKDIPLLIALGKQKNNYVDKNVIYFPIYLVKDPNKVTTSQIGVFESKYSNLPNVLDDDGDIDIKKLAPPLLYGFVDDLYLKSSSRESIDNKADYGLDNAEQDNIKKSKNKQGNSERDSHQDSHEDSDEDSDEESKSSKRVRR